MPLSVTATEAALLVLAGAGAGITGSVAGLASLVSYPALLAVGLGPVAANVTNTVALVAHGIGSALGSRPELRGQGARVRSLCLAAVLGGLTGGALLLLTPGAVFERVVPWLIAGASLAVLRRPRPVADGHEAGPHSWGVRAGVFLISIYGGYFGAAAGVLLLALLLTVSGDSLPRLAAVRSMVLAVANGVAAVAFVLLGPVEWAAAVPMALGFLVGGRVGPIVVRAAPPGPLRLLIAALGLLVAAHLAVEAYA